MTIYRKCQEQENPEIDKGLEVGGALGSGKQEV